MVKASRIDETTEVIRYGMVGGGAGAFIGDVHRKAISLDNKARIVAGAFSRSYENTLQTGSALAIEKDRLYPDYASMAEAESTRDDGIDFVCIVTPNNSHYQIAKTFLENGINVVCDKPLTTDYQQAIELHELAESRNLLFAVTYTYTGYPAIKQAKAMIAAGEIGEIRFINAQYPQEWLAEPAESDPNNKQAAWRTDPARAGISCSVGDIGTHIENMIAYVTDLEIESLAARLDTTVAGRLLDDNASIMVNYKGGARGLYWASQIAWGHDNDLNFGVYGSEGSIRWSQEKPNYLNVTKKDGPKIIISRGRDEFYPHPDSYIRIPSGHPEGYLEAFANLYSTYINAVIAVRKNQTPSEEDLDFPTSLAGANGVKFVEKCVESSKKNAAWVNL